jgi:hypothetical protein
MSKDIDGSMIARWAGIALCGIDRSLLRYFPHMTKLTRSNHCGAMAMDNTCKVMITAEHGFST